MRDEYLSGAGTMAKQRIRRAGAINYARLLRRSVRSILIYALAFGGAFVFMIPFIWMVSTSLKSQTELMDWPPKWIPQPLHWENYRDAWTMFPFPLYYRNTIIITVSVIIGGLLSSSIVAFGFARLSFPGREALFMLVLATMMVPAQVTLIPRFVLFNLIGWTNTFLPLVVPSWFAGSAFNVFLLRQFMMGIPVELEEAAIVDGCGVFGRYWRIILPLTKPALATITIYMFIWAWNDFMGPLIYLRNEDLWTVQLGLARFKSNTLSGNWIGNLQSHWLMAMSVVALIPTLVVFFLAQRYFVEGIQMTGLKG